MLSLRIVSTAHRALCPTAALMPEEHFSSTPTGIDFIDTETGEINLETSSSGTYNITYLITESNGCSEASFTFEITLLPVDDAYFEYSSSTYCLGESSLIPSVTPSSSGNYSASGGGLVIDGNSGEIDLNASQPGSYTISFESTGDCPDTHSTEIEIVEDITINIIASQTEFCNDDDSFEFIAEPVGGVWSSTGTGLSNLGNGTASFKPFPSRSWKPYS
jgi:hypothetical protein